MSLKPIAKSVVTNLKRLVAPRFGQLHRIVESCEARIVRWVWIREIDEAQALSIISTFRVIDDRIYECVNPVDCRLDRVRGIIAIPNHARARREQVEYGEEMPKLILDTFARQNPFAINAGRYSKAVLVLWLKQYQREWDDLLEE